jgi:hypothetical protein
MEAPPPARPSVFVTLAILAGVMCGMVMLAAHFYRQQNCVLFLGHWISVHATTFKPFCE